MLNFFKKNNLSKRNIKGWEYNLLKSLVENLPDRCSFLYNQITDDFFIDAVDNEILKDNWKRVILNQNLYKKYQNKKFNFILKDIKVFDLNSELYISVDLDIFEGTLIGYKIYSDSDSFNLDRIDCTGVKAVKYENQYSDLLNVFSNYDIELFENKGFNNCYKIELGGREFFNFFELENGDLAALDKKGDLFILIHDPFLILFFCTKEVFLEKIKNDTLEKEVLFQYERIFD